MHPDSECQVFGRNPPEAALIPLVPQCAELRLRGAQGAKPAELPVEQPTQFESLINQNAAKSLGITIPASVLFRADQVIE